MLFFMLTENVVKTWGEKKKRINSPTEGEVVQNFVLQLGFNECDHKLKFTNLFLVTSK